MSAEDLDYVIISYMEMYPDIPIKDAYLFFDEIQLIKDWEYFVLCVYTSYLEQDRAKLKVAFETYNQASAFPEIVTSRSEQ